MPVGSQVLPFIFEQITADFQSVTVQGNLSYRIANPEHLARMLNFTLRADGRGYASEDPQNLRARVEGIVEVMVQQAVSMLPLTQVLRSAEPMARTIEEALRSQADVVALGLEIQSLSISAIKPKVETARALEAEVREQILKAADEAIYARRNAAVENERAIKESELDTEVAVELKQRTIRETKMEADAAIRRKELDLEAADLESRIVMEGRRKEFVGLEADNTRTSAEAEAFRVQAVMKALETADPRVVQALASVGMAPGQLIAMAFGGIAEKAEKIGQLNVSPELLQSLMSNTALTKS
ncbi:MAG: SPFH domain-containing protein [Gammaproteobacteria bacterium]